MMNNTNEQVTATAAGGENTQYELGNYAVKSFETFERVCQIELDHVPDPDELLHLWENKVKELQAELKAAHERERELRELCGRGAIAIYRHASYQTPSLLGDLESELRAAALSKAEGSKGK